MAVTLKGQTAVYEGVSTDTKPTDADNNAIFKELDTGIRYYYDGTDWNEIPSSGGGGGGTGTDNYNELNNKPSINGTVLSGNKSLDNLGIQKKLTFDSAPTEDSENPVESGGVYSALAGKQDTISDLSAIRSGADAGATAVQPTELETALAQKQDALSSEQLDAVNSGITSADVEQITTNKNNISTLYKVGSANILKNTAQTQTVGGVTFTMNADGTITANGTKTDNEWLYLSTGNSLKAGTYVLSSGGVTGSDKLVIVTTGDTLGSAIMTTNNATGVYERELTQDYSNLYYAIRIASGTVCDNLLFKPMLCEKSVYEAINGEYQPYAPSNRELFNMIMAL